ncbi:hypothetical protein CerSpe_112080 [Prunus speciosa]
MTLLMDVIYHKGQFLAVTENGELISIYVNSDPATIIRTEATRPCALAYPYLVESSRGDLLLLDRSISESSESFELDHKMWCASRHDGGSQWQWDEIESTGTDALFLCLYRSMSVSASDFPGCHPNTAQNPHQPYAVKNLLKF